MAAAMMTLVRLVLSASLLLLLPAGVWATSFIVVNHCSSTLGVQVAENQPGPTIGTSGFSLSSGDSHPLNPPDGWAGNIGIGVPGLLAEFSINVQPGTDHFDLSAVNGFFLGIGMSITGGNPSVSCSAAASICPSEDVMGNACVSPNRDDPNTSYVKNVMASCPDAYSWSKDDTKDHGTPTGGTFTITFCP